MTSNPITDTAAYIGYRDADRATHYARFYNEIIAPLPAHVLHELALSPRPAVSLPPLSEAQNLLRDGYADLETAYTVEPDGSGRVAMLTPMPGVTPAMWDWWFGWHGSHDNRYKLWHPKAHRSAAWQDGDQTRQAYIGRTSIIEEYIGPTMEKASIRFIDPAELGLVSTADNLFICARAGLTELPVDVGWLVHQVRATEGGSEMRSRFWMGGEHIHLTINGLVPDFLSGLIPRFRRMSTQEVKNIFVHCAEEMNHAAAFLPELYTTFHL
jgi:DAPG hydrolase PhiG domain